MAASTAAMVLRLFRKSYSVSYTRAQYYNRYFSTTIYDEEGDKVKETQKDSSNNVKASHSISAGESALSGFARALGKFSEEKSIEIDHNHEIADEGEESFSAMLRKSKLMQIGETSGRTVLGTIIESVGDDLYIDIGCKFQCVCQRPNFQPELYHRGIRVKIRLNDLEMTSAFLGSDKHVTLQEADGTLIGIHRSSRK